MVMPKIARLDTPGLIHHIMIRGIERRRIFNDDKDRNGTLPCPRKQLIP